MLGSLFLNIKGMRIIMFQLYGFYYTVNEVAGVRIRLVATLNPTPKP